MIQVLQAGIQSGCSRGQRKDAIVQMKIRRSSPKRQRAKQALIAAGAIGLAAESMRRMRHRKHEEPAEH